VITKAAVDDFLAQRTLAVVGASRNRNKFGNTAYRELKTKGYRLFPVNPNAEEMEGDRCYPNLRALPEPVGGVLIVVPPAQTEEVVQEAARAGIRRVWMQRGAQSEAAIRFCQENGISAVHGECILMFAEPAAFYHRVHRWVRRLRSTASEAVSGKLPK
jgi:predicted CoA-binding protein